MVNQTVAQLEYAYRWQRDLETGLNLRYFRNRSTGEDPQSREVDQQIFSLRPWFSYQLDDNFSLQASYRYTYEIDRNDDRTFDRNQVTLLLKYNCDLWP